MHTHQSLTMMDLFMLNIYNITSHTLAYMYHSTSCLVIWVPTVDRMLAHTINIIQFTNAFVLIQVNQPQSTRERHQQPKYTVNTPHYLKSAIIHQTGIFPFPSYQNNISTALTTRATYIRAELSHHDQICSTGFT